MKVLYLDHWVKGINNYLFFDPLLKNAGFDTLLVHISSWHKINEPEEQVLNDVMCRDIAYYKTSSIYKLLSIEKPDVVLVLNAYTIFDRIVKLSCEALGIKSVYLMHGLLANENAMDSQISKLNSKLSPIKKAGRIFRNLKYYIPNYIESKAKAGQSADLIKLPNLIWYVYSNPPRSRYYPIYVSELLMDKCLVYSKANKSFYKNYGFPDENIKVVGNPHNDLVISKINKNAFDARNLPSEIYELVETGLKYAVLVDDSYPENSWYEWTFEYRHQFVLALAERLKKENIVLVVKVKHTTNIDTLPSNADNLIIIPKCDLVDLIKFSEFCIGHTSTVLEIPVLLNKPILIPFWGLSKNADDYYRSNKVGNVWNNIEDVLDLSIDKAARDEFIDWHIHVSDTSAAESIKDEIITL